jgi:hypothetical protein
MKTQPLSPSVPESYPTFWVDESQMPHPIIVPVPPAEAYNAFVNLTEEELSDTELVDVELLTQIPTDL